MWKLAFAFVTTANLHKNVEKTHMSNFDDVRAEPLNLFIKTAIESPSPILLVKFDKFDKFIEFSRPFIRANEQICTIIIGNINIPTTQTIVGNHYTHM